MSIVSVKNLTAEYRTGFRRKKFKAVDDISFSIEKGEIFALLGPNGAGKTTAMLCMLGLLAPAKGKLHVSGLKPERGGKVFERISYLPEEPIYPEFLTVRETVQFYNNLYDKPADSKKIDEVLELLALSDFQNRKISECSKGMKQKAGLAACLVRNPEILFLDELSRGLDPLILRHIRQALITLNEKGTTIIMNSHMLTEVESYCTRAVIMNKGKIVIDGQMKDLLKYDSSCYVVESDEIDLPSWANKKSEKKGYQVYEVPSEKLTELTQLTAQKEKLIYSCYLKRTSLEDIMASLVEKKDE